MKGTSSAASLSVRLLQNSKPAATCSSACSTTAHPLSSDLVSSETASNASSILDPGSSARARLGLAGLYRPNDDVAQVPSRVLSGYSLSIEQTEQMETLSETPERAPNMPKSFKRKSPSIAASDTDNSVSTVGTAAKKLKKGHGEQNMEFGCKI